MQAAISKTHKEIRTTCKKPEFFPEEEIKKYFIMEIKIVRL